MKSCGGVDAQIHVSLTSALARGEWSALRPGRFTQEKEADSRLGGFRSERCREEKISYPTGTRTPWRPSHGTALSQRRLIRELLFTKWTEQVTHGDTAMELP
jgi:hypothetical protein